MAKRTGRLRIQLPHCYYEGFLEKRSFKDKTSRKLWTCLCGNSMFFFNNSKDADYVEKLDLSGFISVTDDCSRDRNLDAARINLRLKGEDIKFTASTLEARELWKGFIYSVVKLSVPSSLNLLPGQIHMLNEAVEKEKERIKAFRPPAASLSATSSDVYLSVVGDMPVCYQHVSRLEAEMMLERNPEKGNLLLRPGRDGNSFAVTTRQHLNGSVFKHYRVTRNHNGGFAIDLENPIPCATLHDVINLLVEKTNGALTPFIMEEPYEDSITFVQSNEENGERSVQFALSNPARPHLPSLPPKPVPRECMPDTEESLYLNDQQENEKEDVNPPSRFRLPMLNPLPVSSLINDSTENSGMEKKPKQAMMPPTPAPRSFTFSSSLSSSSIPTSFPDNLDGRMRRVTMSSFPPDPLADTISEELKKKLEKRRAQE
ncbi:signal-transducing adaptor protein 1-like isoform 2-T2 [Polymixia lowei]